MRACRTYRSDPRLVFAIVTALSAGLILGSQLGCSSSRPKDSTASGRSADPVADTLLASQFEDPMKGMFVDDGARAHAAAVIGRYLDEQAEELEVIGEAVTERIGEEIRVTLSSAVLFDFDSAMLSGQAQECMSRMSEIFTRYDETEIIVAGHTDNTGSESHNHRLSERRARSVQNYLIDLGVDPSRLETVGYGGFRPVATNATDEGRERNRRVEILIHINETFRTRAYTNDGRH